MQIKSNLRAGLCHCETGTRKQQFKQEDETCYRMTGCTCASNGHWFESNWQEAANTDGCTKYPAGEWVAY